MFHTNFRLTEQLRLALIENAQLRENLQNRRERIEELTLELISVTAENKRLRRELEMPAPAPLWIVNSSGLASPLDRHRAAAAGALAKKAFDDGFSVDEKLEP